MDPCLLRDYWKRQLTYCCSVTKLCPTVCDPMDGSTPGFPVLHYFPEFAQTHVHKVSSLELPNSLASLMPRTSKFLWPLAGRIADSPSRKPSMCLGTGSAKGTWVGCRECGICYDAWKHFFKKVNWALTVCPFFPKEFAPTLSPAKHELCWVLFCFFWSK